MLRLWHTLSAMIRQKTASSSSSSSSRWSGTAAVAAVATGYSCYSYYWCYHSDIITSNTTATGQSCATNETNFHSSILSTRQEVPWEWRLQRPNVQCESATTAATTTGTEQQQPSIPTKSPTGSRQSKLIFLGTGSSTGCPRPLCPLLFAPSLKDANGQPIQPPIDEETIQMQNIMKSHCITSNRAMDGSNPVNNRNYRNNPSLLISTTVVSSPPHHETTTTQKNIIIDVGKTFREGALRWLPPNGIRCIDAIVLTHQHMDAAGGLDDVRGFQKYIPQQIPVPTNTEKGRTMETTTKTTTTNRQLQQIAMPLFLSLDTLHCLQNQFPWLLPKREKVPISVTESKKDDTLIRKPIVHRHVASFDVTTFESFVPFSPVPGFQMIPLPVMHGEDLVSYGFAFTLNTTYNVVYISDISRILPETLDYIQNQLPQPTHLLVIDALHMDQPNQVHYNVTQAMELVQQIHPQQTYLVGMNCDSFPPHDRMNELLQQQYEESLVTTTTSTDGTITTEPSKVQLAHDGLVITIPIQEQQE